MAPLVAATALSLLTLAAAPATSGPPTAPATSEAPTVAPATVNGRARVDLARDADKVVCSNQALTGSRFIKRVCLTRAQRYERERRLNDFERRLSEEVGFKPDSNPIGSN